LFLFHFFHFFTFSLFHFLVVQNASTLTPLAHMASKQMLTEVCRKHGLPVTGNKDELWERIMKEEHLSDAISKTLLACPVKKKKLTSPLAQKTIVKHKTLPYEQFCDKIRPLLVAGGMTGKAAIATKLGEMYRPPSQRRSTCPTCHPAHQLVLSCPPRLSRSLRRHPP
jgi:hypothetical protein